MAAEPVPSFVHFTRDPDAQRRILDWIEDVVLKLPWEISAGSFGPGMPPKTLRMADLTTDYLMSRFTSYDERDRAWAKVVQLGSEDGRRGELWRILAIYLSLDGLRAAYWVFGRLADFHERHDIQNDLVAGFLTRLKTVNTSKPNIAGRLVSSAKGNARVQYRHRHPKIPNPSGKGDDLYIRFADIDIYDPGIAGFNPAEHAPDRMRAAMTDLAEEMRAAGEPLHPEDLELIWLSRIDGQTLKQAAAATSLGTEVAYKRRQVAERRIAAVYRIHARRGAHRPRKTPDTNQAS